MVSLVLAALGWSMALESPGLLRYLALVVCLFSFIASAECWDLFAGPPLLFPSPVSGGGRSEKKVRTAQNANGGVMLFAWQEWSFTIVWAWLGLAWDGMG